MFEPGRARCVIFASLETFYFVGGQIWGYMTITYVDATTTGSFPWHYSTTTLDDNQVTLLQYIPGATSNTVIACYDANTSPSYLGFIALTLDLTNTVIQSTLQLQDDFTSTEA